MSDPTRMQWLSDELDTVIQYLKPIPRRAPETREETECYAAGLHEMATWLQEKIEHDISWQGLLLFLGPEAAKQLPKDSSKFQITRKKKQAAKGKP